MANQARGVSFQQLREREEAFDFLDDEEDAQPRRPNIFDDDQGSIAVSDFALNWASNSGEEVAEFIKQSRRLSRNENDDDDKDLGPAWGGSEYSLSSGKPRSDSAAKSVRTRPAQVTSTSSNIAIHKQNSSIARQTPPKRPVPSSPSVQRSVTSTSTSSTSSVSSSPSTRGSPRGSPLLALRNKAPKLPTTKTALQTVSSSINDVISSTPQVSVTEYNKLQAEIRQLRSDLQAARRDKSAVPSAQETVKKIIRGQPYTLEVYKSLKDKLALLDCAIEMHDGNAITAAVLFLRRTVKQRILHNELKKRPKALHHLCKYLNEHYDYTELTELYRSVGKLEEAAMLQFNQAIKTKDPGVRLTQLKYILRHYFEGYPQLSEQTTYLTEYIDLLEQQIQIENADSRAELERKNHVMVAHPRQASLPLNSVIVTLYYCCRYHFGEPENIDSSPLAIRAKFKLSDKQYEWTALAARAKLKQWRGLEQMFTAKGWFGAVKMRSVIGFTQVVELLHQHGAPEEVLNTYLKLVEDQNQRVSLATKTKCHNLAIETLVALKDRQQLEKYRSQLKRTAPEQAKISQHLNNSQIRWKN